MRRRQSGFGYLLVLLLVILMGIGLGAAGTLWRTESQRQKENELLYVGEEYRKALRSYYLASPADAGANPVVPKNFPKNLEELLLDTRQEIQPTRHLRKLYRDPMTGKSDWGMVVDPVTNEIKGVYSLAPGQPLKQKNFSLQQKEFAESTNYQAWRFVASEVELPPVANAQTSAKTNAATDNPNN